VQIRFLEPLAGVVAVLGLVPLVMWFGAITRANRVRARLGLRSPSRRSHVAALTALVAVPGLVGLAAGKPVVEREQVRHVRAGAETLFVIDTSRSMLAARGEREPTRLARARESALALRSSLDDVRVGLASMTDRTLPHLLPSADPDVFAAVVARAIEIDAPPPSGIYGVRATDFGALAVIPTHGYFAPATRRRLVVVFTDGESRGFDALRLRITFNEPPAVETIVLRFWSDEERIYSGGLSDAGYRPDARSATAVARLAEATGGRAYDERELGAATARARKLLEGTPSMVADRDSTETQLAPYLAAAVLIPLSILLARRGR